jgi:hypothetical protein
MTVRRQQRRMFRLSLLLFVSVLLCLSTSVYAESEEKTTRHGLTCKYFDSLMDTHEECAWVYPGHKVTVSPHGAYEVLYRIVIELLRREAFYRDAIEGGNGVIEFISYAVDLNDDHVREVVVLPVMVPGKSGDPRPSYLRGASGSGDILVFQKRGTAKTPPEWQRIGRFDGNLMRVEPYKSNGYYNLIVQDHGGHKDSLLTRYVFESPRSQYRMREKKEVFCVIESERACFGAKSSGTH